MDEQLDGLLAEDPKYRRSKLAWILVMFVPRFRLALHEQDEEGDFDGVMQILWEDLLDDPEVRTRVRERLEKSGVREELRQFLSSHLDKRRTNCLRKTRMKKSRTGSMGFCATSQIAGLIQQIAVHTEIGRTLGCFHAHRVCAAWAGYQSDPRGAG